MITRRKQYLNLMNERGSECVCHYYYYLYGLIEKFDAMIDQMQSTAIGHFPHTPSIYFFIYA